MGTWRSVRGWFGVGTVGVVALTALAFVLRISGLDQSLYGDELFTYELATRGSLAAVVDGVRSSLEVSPPGYNLVAWSLVQISPGQVSSRVPSLIAGVSLVPMVYALGLRVMSRSAGLLAAALLALSPFAIFYSNEARAYSVVAFLVTASTLVLLTATRTDRSQGWWVLFSGLTIAALYTHYTALSVIAAQALWVLIYRRTRWRPALVAFGLAAVAFLPWLPEFVKDREFLTTTPANALTSLLAPFDLHVLLDGVVRWLIGSPFEPLSVIPGKHAWVIYIVGVAAVLVGGLLELQRRRAVRIGAELALVLLVAIAAPLVATAYSVSAGDLFLERYMFVSLPAMIVSSAVIVVSVRGWATIAAAVAFLTAGAIGAARSVVDDARRPDFLGAAQLVDMSAGPKDLIVDYTGSGIFLSGPIADQLTINLRRRHLYYRGVPRAQLPPSLLRDSKFPARVVVVVPAVEGLPSPRTVPGFRLIDEQVFGGFDHLRVLVFERAKANGRRR